MGFIKGLSNRAEFWIVLLVSFGYFTFNSLITFLFGFDGAANYTSSGLIGIVIFELVALTIVVWFLFIRSWDFSKLGLNFSNMDVLHGIGLFVASYLSFLLLLILTSEFNDYSTNVSTVKVSLLSVILVLIVNSFFEEVLVVGYIFNKLKASNSIWFAINFSIMVRLIYHLYQGPIALIAIIPIGIIYTYYYSRTGRIWPLIIAHAITNFFAFYPFIDW